MFGRQLAGAFQLSKGGLGLATKVLTQSDEIESIAELRRQFEASSCLLDGGVELTRRVQRGRKAGMRGSGKRVEPLSNVVMVERPLVFVPFRCACASGESWLSKTSKTPPAVGRGAGSGSTCRPVFETGLPHARLPRSRGVTPDLGPAQLLLDLREAPALAVDFTGTSAGDRPFPPA